MIVIKQPKPQMCGAPVNGGPMRRAVCEPVCERSSAHHNPAIDGPELTCYHFTGRRGQK